MTINSQYQKHPGIFYAGIGFALVGTFCLSSKGAKVAQLFSAPKINCFVAKTLPEIGVVSAVASASIAINVSASHMHAKGAFAPLKPYYLYKR